MLEHETEASPAADLDVTEASSPGPDAISPEVAADGKPEAPQPTLLDVVRDVVEPKSEDAPAEASSAPEAEKPEGEETGDTAPAADPENFDAEPFGRHPRFKQVLSQRNEFRAEAEKLRKPAESYAKIEAFLETTGVTNEEMVNLFKVAALAKSDPEEALKALSPLMSDLYERTGAFMPDDLKTEVEEGKITEERARELAKARAIARENERRATHAQERAERVETTTREERQRQSFETTLAEWEAATKGKDPDFAAKEDFIADRCRALIAEKGQPRSADEMRAILEQAHTDVTARMRKSLPARPEAKGPRSGASPTTATAVPKTFLEAVTLAAQQGR